MTQPTLLWIRRDLRLSDHEALTAALDRGGAVIPVFIRDQLTDDLGAASKQRLDMGLRAFDARLRDHGSRLILRSGPAREVLEALVRETGADAVCWQRLYEPAATERDTRVKSALKDAGIEAASFAGHLLFEPWTVETGQGGPYRVFSPYWRAVKDRPLGPPRPAPTKIAAPGQWPASESLDDWSLTAPMRRGAAVLARHVEAGEEAALQRLAHFMRDTIDGYASGRDDMGDPQTSDLSHFLTWGEISPRRCWQAALRAGRDGKAGAETFRKELVWREFAAHLAWHMPRMLDENWREEWRFFPWDEDETRPEVIAWKQGRTGVEVIDAAMRELYVTGRMHNRARMITASYLTKNLLAHWRIGQKWFEDCLVDWDPASNAMGWQWVAGSGPDAAPYFRVFNPVTQGERFDGKRRYRDRWLAEGRRSPAKTALDYYAAIPESWGLSPQDRPPEASEDPKEGRARALAAYAEFQQRREENAG